MSYPPTPLVGAEAQQRQRSFLGQVYLWMTAGLLVTAAVAAYTASAPSVLNLIYGNPFTIWVLFIAQIGLVIGLSARIDRLAPPTAVALFIGYAALNGLTLSAIFIVYTYTSIAQAFLATAATFGVMSLYGATTKRDLSTAGNLLVMALIGFLIGSLINLFWANSALYWVLTYLGIAIFIGLTAYDTQQIKRLIEQAQDDTTARRLAIIGALKLYLDFINLFVLLLRVFGSRDE
ncbi:MAG TPA: Bax inhibitor-1/YccA family protein [Roseiflexaceae bacterium]|nr:Bax inhibitor-1/YccA family protein [Roseiflexaceae bacterium]